MKPLNRPKYPDEIRNYVWRRYQSGAGARKIFDEVMGRWPDCGMKTFRSVCMMIGPLKVERGLTGTTAPQRHFRSSPAATPARESDGPAPISLAGPSWSRGAK